MSEEIIKRAVALSNSERVTVVGFKNYVFTYKGEHYSARCNLATSMWTVGVITESGCIPMAIRKDLGDAIDSVKLCVDQISNLVDTPKP
jgi:hypothetical protein